MRRIGGPFGRPPYGPIHEHMTKVGDCLENLVPLIEAFLANDYDKVEEVSAVICRIESEADAIKTEIRERLSHSLFSAIERSEVIELLKVQDDVADDCQNVAWLIDARRTDVPAGHGNDLLELGSLVVDTVRRLTATTNSLQLLPGKSPTENAIADVVSHADEVREIYDKVEDQAHRTLKSLFAAEEDIHPIGIVLMMQIVREMARTAHSAENTADSIVRLIVR